MVAMIRGDIGCGTYVVYFEVQDIIEWNIVQSNVIIRNIRNKMVESTKNKAVWQKRLVDTIMLGVCRNDLQHGPQKLAHATEWM